MFIKYDKGGKGRRFTYVSVVEAYRDDDGKIRQRVIEKLGRKDLLLERDPDAIRKLEEKYGGSREQKDSRAAALRIEQSLTRLGSVPESNQPHPILKYGHYPIRSLWRSLLQLDRKFDYVQKSTRFGFDLDEAACFMTASKILSPSSILDTYDRQDQYLGSPLWDVPLDSLYKLYSVMDEQKDSLMKWVGRSLARELPDDRKSLIFYDVTNTYFETALTDAEQGREQKDFQDNFLDMVAQAREEGMLGAECFNDDGEVIPERLPAEFLEMVAGKKIQYLRMRGPSKEHRYDLPLISVALVIDKYGIPMDFEVFAGNSSEFKTMEQVVAKFQEKYAIRNAVLVADRGLNSGGNLNMLQQHNLGYLMAQKVSNLGRELTARMLDESLYEWFDPEDHSKGRYQLVRNWRKKTEVGAVECTLVFTFNEKRKKRDETILNIWRNMVEANQAKGVKVKPRAAGWTSLAKIDDDLKKGAPIIGVDEKEFQRQLGLCGYSALIYKDPPVEKTSGGQAGDPAEPVSADELSLLPGRVADCYHQLNQIEDCFRVMKTNLRLRPMYVRNSDHVKGHVCICVLALVLVRIIQRRLRQKGIPMSINKICRTLAEAELVAWKTGSGELTLHAVQKGAGGIRKGREGLRKEELVELVREWKKEPKPIDQIMESCGLVPLVGSYNRNELSRSLATKFRTGEEIVGPLVWAQMD
ncbi:MAG: transposase [Akkermansia sp.]|nr:transposase [Akkermansia sp.]